MVKSKKITKSLHPTLYGFRELLSVSSQVVERDPVGHWRGPLQTHPPSGTNRNTEENICHLKTLSKDFLPSFLFKNRAQAPDYHF